MRTHHKAVAGALLTGLLALSSNPLLAADAATTVTVDDAYVREVPPGQPNSAAFMTIDNPGEVDLALVSAASSVADTVELHTHLQESGVMKMRQVERIDLPAATKTVLQPGGLHVMLIGLEADLIEGENVTITLMFADGSEKSVDAPVRKLKMKMGGGSEGHQSMQGHSNQ